MANRKQERAKAAAESVEIVNERNKGTKPSPFEKKPKVAAPNLRKKQEAPAKFSEFLKTLPKDHPFHDLAKTDPLELGKEIERQKTLAKAKIEGNAGRKALTSNRGTHSGPVAEGTTPVSVSGRSMEDVNVNLSKKQLETLIAISSGKKPKKEKVAKPITEPIMEQKSLFGSETGRTKIDPLRRY